MVNYFQSTALLFVLASANASNGGNDKPSRLRALGHERVRKAAQEGGCLEAASLEVGQTVEDKFTSPDGDWYSVIGTGGYLAVSTCTEDTNLNENGVDTIIAVFSGDCSSPAQEAYDDDSGDCGGNKSTAYFEAKDGETYLVNVAPFGGTVIQNNNKYGLVVFQVDALPDYNQNYTYYPSCQVEGECCETAVPLELDQAASIDSNGMSPWFSFAGTGGYLKVQVCSETNILGDVFGDIYSGGCYEMSYVTSLYGSGVDCAVTYVESTAEQIYHLSVYGYYYGVDGEVNEGDDGSDEAIDPPGTDVTVGWTVTISEVAELPNTICGGATPLELGEIAEGEIQGSMYGQSVWYSVVGTGGDLVISTCTGNETLDTNEFDSVLTVHAARGGCNDLRFISTDDEGGKCGHGKSQVILSSVEGLMYKIAVNDYYGMSGQFGIVVTAKSTSNA